MNILGLASVSSGRTINLSTPLGIKTIPSQVYKGHVVIINDRSFACDLMVMNMDDIDILLGMYWLVKYKLY